MRSLWKMYNKNFWKSVFGPVLTFVIPTFVVILFLCVFDIPSNATTYILLSPCLVPSLIFLGMYSLSILIFPQSVSEIINSIFAKQLVASSIKKWMIPVAGVLYYAILNIFTIFFSFLGVYVSGLIMPNMHETMNWIFTQINWWAFIYTVLINVAMALTFGAMLGMICRSISVISLIGVLLLFVSLVLAGFICPIMLIPTQHPALWIVSYFDFIRYPVSMSFEAVFSHASTYNVYGSNLFDFSTPYYTQIMNLVSYPFEVLKPVDKILNMTVPYLVILGSVSTILFVKRGN